MNHPLDPVTQDSASTCVIDSDMAPVSLLDLAVIAAENARLLLGASLVSAALCAGIATVLPPVYTARAVVMPPQRQQSSAAAVAMQSLGALGNLAGAASMMPTAVEQYVSLMQSVTVVDELIDAHKLEAVYESRLRSETRKILARNTRINAGKKDGLITVEVDDHDARRAAELANAYVDQLQALLNRLTLTEARQRREFFERRLLDAKSSLAQAERGLQVSGFNGGALRAEPRAAAENYARLKAETTNAEIRMQSMRSYLTAGAPELKVAQATVNALRTQLKKAEAVDADAANGDYVSRYREFKYQETLFDMFARQYELARLDESREGTAMQRVDTAIPADRKSRPNEIIFALGGAVVAPITVLFGLAIRHAIGFALRGKGASANKLMLLQRALKRSRIRKPTK